MRVWVSRVTRLVYQHPFWSIFVLAVLLRTIGILVVSSAVPATASLDPQTYFDLATDLAQGETNDWSPYLHQLADASASLVMPVAFLVRLFGPQEWLGQAYVASFGILTAIGVTAFALQVASRWAAVIAGLVVAAMPSQVLWSSLIFKDALTWSALVALSLLYAHAARSERVHLLFASFLSMTVLIYFLTHLRAHLVLVVGCALMLVSLSGTPKMRWPRFAAALVVAIFAPWLFGLGPVGLDVVTQSRPVEETRASLSSGNTAIVQPDEDPSSTEASEDPSEAPPAEEGAEGHLQYLPHGLAAFLLRPFPWENPSNHEFLFARLENTFIWYPLAGLALVGIYPALTRHRLLMIFPIVMSGGIILVHALAEGNVGTAFRHRAQVVWLAAVLAAITVSWIGHRATRNPSVDRS